MTKFLVITSILAVYHIFGQESQVNWKELDSSLSLKSFVENQAFEYLEFEPVKKDSVYVDSLTINHEGVDTEIIIRDSSNVKNPLIIINQYPLEDLVVLGYITLQDIESIDLYRPSDELSGIYGYAAKFGLINISMHQKKWRNVRRKYGR